MLGTCIYCCNNTVFAQEDTAINNHKPEPGLQNKTVNWYSNKIQDEEMTGAPRYIINSLSGLKYLPQTCVFVGVSRDCKVISYIFIDTASMILKPDIQEKESPQKIQPVIAKKKSLLTVHGNVMYDFYYQSHLDTPYAGNDLNQHTVTTYLDIKVKDNYPLRVYLTSRMGNVSYLKNIINLNFQYSPQIFQNTVREKILFWAQQQFDTTELARLRGLLQTKTQQLAGLKDWVNSPSILQRLVEEKEAEYVRQRLPINTINVINQKDSLTKSINPYSSSTEFDSRFWLASLSNKGLEKVDSLSSKDSTVKTFSEEFAAKKRKVDSLQSSLSNKGLERLDSLSSKDSTAKTFSEEFAAKKRKVDSLQAEIQRLQNNYSEKKDSLTALKNEWVAKFNKTRDPNQLKELLQNRNPPDSILPKGYKTLLAVQKLSVGTSVVDYSELSAKNVTITGLQVEYNPKYYYAIAGGIINYRFRDYLLPEAPGPKQYLGLVRFGKGTKNGNSLILTYYYGRKNLYNYYTTDSLLQATTPQPNYNLMGLTLENRIKLNENSYLIAEVAKSSLPYYHSTGEQKGLTGTFDLSDHSNEAYSLKISSTIPSTKTKLEGYFKHYGANFQSFTLISTSSEQNAWMVKADQQLFKKQLSLAASVRKNDYINPFVDQRYVSNTVFKSLQATLRVKKLPVLSMGYYPTSQLIKLNDVTYMESLFYTLTANLSYFYNRRHTGMSTSITYMRFYNRPADTGFVYYNTKNIIASHTVFFSAMTLQSGFSTASNNNYNLWTWNENIQAKCNKWLSLGGGVKYNKQNILNDPQIGYEINSTIKINRLGNFQLRAEKMFMPGIDRQLVANNTGRFTYYRTF